MSVVCLPPTPLKPDASQGGVSSQILPLNRFSSDSSLARSNPPPAYKEPPPPTKSKPIAEVSPFSSKKVNYCLYRFFNGTFIRSISSDPFYNKHSTLETFIWYKVWLIMSFLWLEKCLNLITSPLFIISKKYAIHFRRKITNKNSLNTCRYLWHTFAHPHYVFPLLVLLHPLQQVFLNLYLNYVLISVWRKKKWIYWNSNCY